MLFSVFVVVQHICNAVQYHCVRIRVVECCSMLFSPGRRFSMVFAIIQCCHVWLTAIVSCSENSVILNIVRPCTKDMNKSQRCLMLSAGAAQRVSDCPLLLSTVQFCCEQFCVFQCWAMLLVLVQCFSVSFGCPK